jgi:hypothetical protein
MSQKLPGVQLSHIMKYEMWSEPNQIDIGNR